MATSKKTAKGSDSELADAAAEYQKENRRLYEADIKERHQTIRLMSLEYDKGILSFSTAGLGLSWAFLKDSGSYLPLLGKGILFLSWASFTAAIFAILASLRFSLHAESVEINRSKEYYIDEDMNAFSGVNRAAELNNLFGNIGAIFFGLAVLLTIGIAGLILFNHHQADGGGQRQQVFVMKGATNNMNEILQRGMPVSPRIPANAPPQAQPAPQSQPITAPTGAGASGGSGSGQK